MRITLIAILLLAVPAMLALAQDERPRCETCGMFWDASPTRLTLEVDLGDSTVVHLFECVNCGYNGLDELYDEEPDVIAFEILDYTTFGATDEVMLDGFEAWYLFGTKRLKGSMAPFTPAFATKAAAEKAQKDLGGELVEFEGMMKLLAEHNGDEYEGGVEGHEPGSMEGGLAYICPCPGGCCDDIVADKPGECPRCGMTLVAREQ